MYTSICFLWSSDISANPSVAFAFFFFRHFTDSRESIERWISHQRAYRSVQYNNTARIIIPYNILYTIILYIAGSNNGTYSAFTSLSHCSWRLVLQSWVSPIIIIIIFSRQTVPRAAPSSIKPSGRHYRNAATMSGDHDPYAHNPHLYIYNNT
jgi:hypothetical protein